MEALIFDFDGVVVDSEPIHLAGFQQVLSPLGADLSRDAYYSKYLGYDDYDCLAAVLDDHGIAYSESQLAELIAAKTHGVQKAMGESIQPLDGSVELIRLAAQADVPIAVCSGALRDEIHLAARAVGIWEHFTVVTSAEDVSCGKPSPEGYQLTLRRLAETGGSDLRAEKCIVVEDAPAGIEAAKAAGMKVLAVTNSYPAETLHAADRIVASLAEVTIASLDELL